MPDFLDVLARDAKVAVGSGYYEHPAKAVTPRVSLRKAILHCPRVPVIAEVKGTSPSAGVIREKFEAGEIASAMARGGAAGISVLTEPKHFNGSLQNLAHVRKAVNLPVLMKDVIISPVQLDAAAKIGANAVLLIQAVYDRGYGELSIAEMIEEARMRELEVLLETHDEDEFRRAATSEADLVGINNRNLATLQVDLNVTKRILEGNRVPEMLVVSESGIRNPDDIRFLSRCGANAFLVGSAVMSSGDVEGKVREFTMALSPRKQGTKT
jgi:indole-3-glycerol phosphate synthase